MFYISVSFISVVIRNFIIPNPFGTLHNGLVYNWIFSIILVPVCYSIVGIFYRRGEAPMIGSLAFLLGYIVLTFITNIMVKLMVLMIV